MVGNSIDITPYVVPNVANTILSDTKISFIYGWRDGGKSTTAFNVLLWKCLLDRHFRFAHCRAKYNEIAGSTFQTLKDCIKLMKLENYFIIRNDRFQIINKQNPDNYFFGASADQPDKIRSTANLSGFIVDEAHDLTESDFSSLIGTLRENKNLAVPTKSIFIFNNDKVKEKSFISKNFFNNESAMYDKVDRCLVTYLDNPFIDKEKTKEKLLQVCLGDVNKFNYLMSGEFMKEQNENPFFYSLSQIHKTDDEYMPDTQQFIDLSFDFNANPCTLVVGQHDRKNKTFHVFDYLTANQDTLTGLTPLEAVCTLFERIYIKSGITSNYKLRITGDASGQSSNADRQKNQNYYTTIQRILKVHLKSQASIRSTNLPHEISGNICNHALRTLQSRILFHTNGSVYHLFQEMESAQADEKNTLNTWKKEAGGHGVDAVRYLFTDLWFKAKDWFNFINNMK